jgi:hypothetical protein
LFRGVPLLKTRSLALGFGLTGLVSAASAVAAPPAGDVDSLVQVLEGDAAHQALVAEPLRRAKAALARAKSLDVAGDAAHAALFRGTAREWAELGRDLIRTSQAEAQAVAAERALDDFDTKIVRERTLLEETVGRRARAAEALEQIERNRSTGVVAAPGPTEGIAPKPGPSSAPHPANVAPKAQPGAAPSAPRLTAPATPAAPAGATPGAAPHTGAPRP